VTASGGAAPFDPKVGLRVVGTTVTREIDLLFERLAASVGRRVPRVLQIGSRTNLSDRNERNW
jgi:hypothetical protein